MFDDDEKEADVYKYIQKGSGKLFNFVARHLLVSTDRDEGKHEWQWWSISSDCVNIALCFQAIWKFLCFRAF